ncbi:hypothetical protein AAU61_05800 [Desulfocarbo indianensis]|nr:hypothetical protein AAU61_05800 [Desulfocarbo indianensis]
MSGCRIPAQKIEQTVEFHGHWCPGLAIGIRASEYVLNNLGRATDEDIVAVVETDMCGVDAIQVLTGCTFGKGNLLYSDQGKMAFSFYHRGDGKGVRLVFKSERFWEEAEGFFELTRKWLSGQAAPEETEKVLRMREERAQYIMAAPFEELFAVKEPARPMPRPARILQSLTCEACGESVMESRSRRLEGRTLCLACFEAQDKWH